MARASRRPKILLTAKKTEDAADLVGGGGVGRENRNDGDMKRGRIQRRFCVWPQHQFKTKVTEHEKYFI